MIRKSILVGTICFLIVMGASVSYMQSYESSNEEVCESVLESDTELFSDEYINCIRFMHDRTIFYWQPFGLLALLFSCLGGLVGAAITEDMYW